MYRRATDDKCYNSNRAAKGECWETVHYGLEIIWFETADTMDSESVTVSTLKSHCRSMEKQMASISLEISLSLIDIYELMISIISGTRSCPLRWILSLRITSPFCWPLYEPNYVIFTNFIVGRPFCWFIDEPKTISAKKGASSQQSNKEFIRYVDNDNINECM